MDSLYANATYGAGFLPSAGGNGQVGGAMFSSGMRGMIRPSYRPPIRAMPRPIRAMPRPVRIARPTRIARPRIQRPVTRRPPPQRSTIKRPVMRKPTQAKSRLKSMSNRLKTLANSKNLKKVASSAGRLLANSGLVDAAINQASNTIMNKLPNTISGNRQSSSQLNQVSIPSSSHFDSATEAPFLSQRIRKKKTPVFYFHDD